MTMLVWVAADTPVVRFTRSAGGTRSRTVVPVTLGVPVCIANAATHDVPLASFNVSGPGKITYLVGAFAACDKAVFTAAPMMTLR